MSYDGPRFPSLTPAIKQLLLVNAAVFFLNMLLLGRLSAPTEGGGGYWFAFSWSLSLDGFGLGALRLLTYQFTHAFADPWHFLGNMMVLFFMGTIAEQRLGYRGTWKLYVLGGVAGALPPSAAADLLKQVDDEAASLAAAIPMAPLAVGVAVAPTLELEQGVLLRHLQRVHEQVGVGLAAEEQPFRRRCPEAVKAQVSDQESAVYIQVPDARDAVLPDRDPDPPP